MIARLDLQRARVMLAGQIAFHRFLWVFANPQRVQLLKVRMPFQKDDPLDQTVGMVHLFNALGAGLGSQMPQTPILL